jgi:hypothetical protein
MLVIFVCKELVVFNDEDLLQNLVVKIAGRVSSSAAGGLSNEWSARLLASRAAETTV